MSRLAGPLLVLVAAMCFAATTVLGKVLLQSGVDLLSMLSTRFIAAGLMLLASLAIRRKPLLAWPGERATIVVLAVAGYGLQSMVFFLGTRRASLGVLAAVFYTYPAIVAAGSRIFFKQSLGRMGLLALALCGSGSALVAIGGDGAGVSVAAVAPGLIASLIFALYLLGMETRVTRSDPATAAAWTTSAAGVGLGIAALVIGEPRALTPEQWPALLAMSVATGIAFTALLAGLPRMGAGWTSILMLSEAVAIPIFGWLALGEMIPEAAVFGGAFVIVGAALACAGVVAPAEPT